MEESLEYLPEGLPIPTDDGSCNHLIGMSIPNIKLKATNGKLIELKNIDGRVVFYLYPMTGPSHIPFQKGGMKFLEQEVVPHKLALLKIIMPNYKN